MSDVQTPIRHRDRDMVPRALVQGMFGLMFATTALVAFATFTDRPHLGVLVEAPIAASLQIVMTGDRAGIYQVHDLAGNQLALSSENKAGFIGVIGRTFDRERQLRGVTSDEPVTVLRRENGHIAIVDETTGMSVELIGYGVDNVAAFARLLD
ncbi:photosynthetic complex assembly protein PuhC [Yoonia sp.]|jgi:putative photosynthetic complex assembly protein|uniref:photosynthetic complex assembly protein PuhC n=1 Tax=Yoonia sp. TaxID=2212373 RepID=UPI0025DE2C35|nr:photosynthetic complex assembly protein PuhC [Yoonia sp.]